MVFHRITGKASDYVYRGVSLSGGEAARQASIDYHNDNGAFAGWWVSTMEFAPPAGPNTEHNLYAGYSQRWNDSWRSDISATYFNFRGGRVGPDNAFTQLQVSTTYADALTARLFYAEDTYGMRFTSKAAELEYPYAFTEHWSFDTLIGYWNLENFSGTSYYYTDFSLRYQLRHCSVSLHHHDTTQGGRDTYGEAAASDWLVMVALGF